MKAQTKVSCFILSLVCLTISACGVKGKPLPPLKPAPISDPNNRKADDKNH